MAMGIFAMGMGLGLMLGQMFSTRSNRPHFNQIRVSTASPGNLKANSYKSPMVVRIHLIVAVG
jgi:hypothetical protein